MQSVLQNLINKKYTVKDLILHSTPRQASAVFLYFSSYFKLLVFLQLQLPTYSTFLSLTRKQS